VLFDKYPWTQQFSANYEAYLLLAKRSLEEKLRVCEVLTGVRPKSMLDVGCGNGQYLHAGTLLGLKVLGTEVDASSAGLADQRGLHVKLGKLEDLDIPDHFDFIHLRMILYMVPRPVSLLRSAAEKATEGGVVYVDTSHQDGIFSRLRRIFGKNSQQYGQLTPPRHCVSYTKLAFRSVLARSGLSPRRFFTYSARDPIYYPLLAGSAKDHAVGFVKAKIDYLGMGAFLAAYCVQTKEK
jgi:SAM-dependent methyltransferase